MHDESLELALRLVRCGRLSFDAFVRRTRRVWRALAESLLRRWRAPGVAVDDVEQEVILNVWRFIPKWDPNRGVTLSRYVIYNSCDKAKKWLHCQRNAYRRDDRSPGRYETPVSALGLESHAEERLLERVSVEPDQERELVERRTLAELASTISLGHQLALVAVLEEGDPDLAACSLLADPKYAGLSLASLGQARRFVSAAMEAALAAREES